MAKIKNEELDQLKGLLWFRNQNFMAYYDYLLKKHGCTSKDYLISMSTGQILRRVKQA